MSKPLGTGILFILGVVLLYLGGTSNGGVGAGLAIGGLVCFVAAIISGARSIAMHSKRSNQVATSTSGSTSVEPKSHSEDKYAHLEKKRGWRAAKVVYWLVIVYVIVFSLFHVDYYDKSDMQGLAYFVALICLPLYLLYRKVAYYIVSGE